MFDAQWELKGYEETLGRLVLVSAELRERPMKSALGKAAAVVKEQAQENALRVDDKGTGRQISENIIQRYRSRFYRDTGDMMVSIGVGTPRGRIPPGNPDEGEGGPTFHWHLIELGTEKTAARPFLVPALTAKAPAAIDKFAESLNESIDKLLKRAARARRKAEREARKAAR